MLAAAAVRARVTPDSPAQVGVRAWRCPTSLFCAGTADRVLSAAAWIGGVSMGLATTPRHACEDHKPYGASRMFSLRRRHHWHVNYRAAGCSAVPFVCRASSELIDLIPLPYIALLVTLRQQQRPRIAWEGTSCAVAHVAQHGAKWRNRWRPQHSCVGVTSIRSP